MGVRFGIVAKIAAGFGLLIAAVCVAGWIGLSGLAKTEEKALHSARLAALTHSAVEVQEGLLRVEGAVRSYLVDRDEASLGAVRKSRDEASAALAALQQKAESPEAAAEARAIGALLTDYSAAIEELSRLIDAQYQLTTNGLFRLGPNVDKAYSALAGSFLGTRNLRGLQALEASRSQFRRAGDSFEKFLRVPVKRLADETSATAQGALRLLEPVARSAGGGAAAELSRGLQAKLVDWTGKFTALAQSLAASDQLMEERVKRAGAKLFEAISTVTQSALAQQRRAGEEAVAETKRSGRQVEAVILVALLLGGLTAWRISKEVSSSVAAMLAALKALADGDLTRRAAVQTRDEIGDMSDALDAAMGRLAGVLRAVIGSAEGLAGEAGKLGDVSQRLGATAEETASQSRVVSEAAGDASTQIGSVAAAMEEMSASIREIAKSATGSTATVGAAVQAVHGASQTLTHLGNSSQQIGGFSKLISGIAEQTNLLALNATIESARAGAAGKGFAVVAAEVKQLAGQTGRATSEIEQRIQGIQGDTESSIRAFAQIEKEIGQVELISATISAAVEEQSATVGEISRGVTRASQSTTSIAEGIGSVATAAKETAGEAHALQGASAGLSRMAAELKEMVGRFRC